jgi:hypothetical protein
MSTEVKPAANVEAGAAAPNEEIKNLKSEFNRKIDNLAETNKQLLNQLNNMAKTLVPPKKPETPQAAKKVSVYEDEEAYARSIKEETKAELREEIQRANQLSSKQQTTIASLVKDFPELNDGESDLAKKAIEIFNAMPEDERNSPVAYKAAVKEAALDLDIKPKSKRKPVDSDDEAFTLSSSSRRDNPRDGGQKKVDRRTALFAEALGVDVKKVESRINKRKSFTSWE